METKNSSSRDLPPGFRFHPTDEELIMYYLRNQATSRPCPVSIIPEVDIYKFDPWQLPEKAEFGENEWYFFTPRDRKYPNGARPNRATVSGYWKATGTDKAIHSGSKYVGVKKALVFYKGRPPKGIKTDWIMHEYRLFDSNAQPSKHNGSMRLDDWVLCRIYKKRPMAKTLEQKFADDQSRNQMDMVTSSDHHQDATTTSVQNNNMLNFPRTYSLTHLFELECLGSITQLLSDNSCNNSTFDFQNVSSNINGTTTGGSIERCQFGEIMPSQYADYGKYQVNQNQQQQPLIVNPVYELQ